MEQDVYSSVSFLLGSPVARKILECLASSERPLNPKLLSAHTGVARSNVSTKLGGLRKRGLAECVNPADRKWRFYRATEKGKTVLAEVRRAV
jgi:DNA-binding MarR family transcriptional regulator